ncbi:uncharacterized protein DFL_006551 [Arthrobotrys flagrans]|uniref:Ig-like domain-containing protein n=1 Tax=Arthrobotrys flagrans TaxID=97331 RepID=A0A436ZT44_ARTFL|nr:hypothetical protein DFL_006551 [Arthrobotrys flagrans]
MKFTIVALATAAAVNAQLVFNETTGTFQCLGDAAGKNFCAGNSLSTNIIIRCNGERGQPGNCNNNLAGVPPIGVKSSALCWQTSETSGDAGCSFEGIVHADDGTTFPIPSSSSSSSTVEPTYGASSTSSAEPTYGASSTSPAEPTYGASSTSSAEPTYGDPTSVEPTYAPTTSVEPTSSIYPTLSWTNTTSVYYPPGTTLVTVTGTHTITSCDTTTTVPVPTNTYVPPPTNHTSTYTTGLPAPTQFPSGAGALLAKDSLVLGFVALVGFMFL